MRLSSEAVFSFDCVELELESPAVPCCLLRNPQGPVVVGAGVVVVVVVLTADEVRDAAYFQ